MLYMKFPPTTQQLEEAGFDKGQAEVLAVCFVITDQRHDDVMTLLRSLVQKMDATNQSLVAFQLETTQKFSDFQRETERRFTETHASLIKWMAGTALTVVFGVSAIGAGFLWFFMRFGAG